MVVFTTVHVPMHVCVARQLDPCEEVVYGLFLIRR